MGAEDFDADTEAVLSALEAELTESGARVRLAQRRRLLAGVVGMVCGLVVVLAGLSIHLVVSVVGFAMMLAGALLCHDAFVHLARMGSWDLSQRFQGRIGRWSGDGWPPRR